MALPRLAVYGAGLVPAIWLFALAVTGRIGADPVAQLEWGLGLWALRFLVITLCITPLRQLTRLNFLRYRRATGLLAFYYTLLHFCTWLALDRALEWQAVLADMLRRPWITIGMAAFSLLLPLALTSNNRAIRAMGGKAWNRLHRLVYPVAALAALHFIMVKKVWLPEPIIYAAIIAALLGYRVYRAFIRPPPKRRNPASG